MTSIYEENVSAKVRLIHAEQIPFYNFIILRKKTDSKTGVFLRNLWNFQEQWWLLLKTRNILLRRAQISHLQRRPFHCIAITVNPMMRHEAQAWSGATLRGTSRQQKRVAKQKEVLLMLYDMDKNWYHFIKNISNNFQNLLFRKLLSQLGNQADIFWKFYSPADILWSPKTVARVVGYTTGSYWEEIEYFLLNSILSTNQKIVVSKTSFFCHHDRTF